MWDSISRPWQAAFEQGWEAFKRGSIPIGAVITDENDNVISTGRNRLYENASPNPKIDHAETDALRKLNVSRYPNVYQYTLYACMEPCPMCLGTFVMANLRKLRIAARDSYCGAGHYCKDDLYIATKKIQISYEYGLFETVQLAIQAYFELRACNGEMNNVTRIFQKDNPLAIKIAESLFDERYLDLCAENDDDFSNVFNEIELRSK